MFRVKTMRLINHIQFDLHLFTFIIFKGRLCFKTFMI